MPRVINPVEIDALEKESHKDYFDRHSPHVVCDDTAQRGKKFMVKVIMGRDYLHPDDADHYISNIQLWNRETLIAQAQFSPGMMSNNPEHVEVDFYIVPKVSMNLSAMAVCTKHGLWQSDSKEVKVIE
jgi:superoxide reductase